MKLILLGAPGAGKGTQAKYICDKYSIVHVSTGDIFRKNISEKTPLGNEAKRYIDSGKLVPDEVTISMLLNRIVEDDCKNGYILDGFPRTVKQAEALTKFLNKRNEFLDKVLLINVPKKFVLDRVTGRRVCPKCGASYHVLSNPPKVEGKCDDCGASIIQRSDDNETSVNQRLQEYTKQTEPLIEYYTKMKILKDIDGTKSIDKVFKDICAVLEEK